MINKLKIMFWSFCCWALYLPIAFADASSGPIPLSQAIINEANNDGIDGTWMYVLQSVVLPIAEIIFSSLIIVAAISAILTGVEESKVEHSWAPLKMKITVAVLVIIFGGLCVFLMDKLRTYSFGG